jgi:hypothetical protein
VKSSMEDPAHPPRDLPRVPGEEALAAYPPVPVLRAQRFGTTDSDREFVVRKRNVWLSARNPTLLLCVWYLMTWGLG